MIYFQKGEIFYNFAEDIMQRRFVNTPKGESKLFGYDFDCYPVHKFRSFNMIPGSVPLFAITSGRDIWRKECFRQRINSDVFAIEYVQSGVFIFNHNGIEKKMSSGEIFLLHKGSNSSMRCEGDFAVKRVIIMEGKALLPLLNITGLDRVYHLKPAELSRIDALFDEIDAFDDSDDDVDWTGFSALCYELVLNLAGQIPESLYPPALQKALQFISRNLDNSLSLDELSGYVGVSNATLYRMFQTYLNSSPVNWFISEKLEKARNLLAYYPVKEVAAMLNYSSAQYFSGEFKKHFGVSPKNFRCRKQKQGS